MARVGRGKAAGFEEQRLLILNCATALFAQRGYPGTSMSEVASASGVSKPLLYHYFQDKYTLLTCIVEERIARLQEVVAAVLDAQLPAKKNLEQLILSFVREYADAQYAHRVLIENVRFLNDLDKERILSRERQIVAVFAGVIKEIRPEISEAGLAKPLTMLLFGMINWMFTWLKQDGKLTYEDMAPVVTEFFFGGLAMVSLTQEERALP